jgi:ATP/maltotriose-dependent transcriptional regulator MalT
MSRRNLLTQTQVSTKWWMSTRRSVDRRISRALDVLRLIASGASNRDAAAQLFISESTVKTHLLHIYEKLGVRDRAAAVGEAYKRRLLS